MKIAIIENNEKTIAALVETIVEAGHTAFVILATNQHRVAIVSRVREFNPDVVMIEHDLGLVDGSSVTKLLRLPKEKIIGFNPRSSDQYCGQVFDMKSRMTLDPHEEDEIRTEVVMRNRERLIALVKCALAA